jgi:hypothetical protein
MAQLDGLCGELCHVRPTPTEDQRKVTIIVLATPFAIMKEYSWKAEA